MLSKRNESCSRNFHRIATGGFPASSFWHLSARLSSEHSFESPSQRERLSMWPRKPPDGQQVGVAKLALPTDHRWIIGHRSPCCVSTWSESWWVRSGLPAYSILSMHSLFASIFHQPHKDHQLSVCAFRWIARTANLRLSIFSRIIANNCYV